MLIIKTLYDKWCDGVNIYDYIFLFIYLWCPYIIFENIAEERATNNKQELSIDNKLH